MASKYCGYLATDTCRPQPARVPCATQRWGVGAQLSFLLPLVVCILCCLATTGLAIVDNSIIAVNILFVIIPVSCPNIRPLPIISHFEYRMNENQVVFN